MSSVTIEQLPETRREILSALKREGAATISELAESLGLTGEAVRQQLLQLRREKWVDSRIDRDSHSPKSGRPATKYGLTAAGDHLFPKQYDQLALNLLDTIRSELGDDALESVLAGLAQRMVEAWEPVVKDLPIRERIEALKEIYCPDDPYARVVGEEKAVLLVERNCPYLNAAVRRPALCSVTVHALTRLTGVRVIRQDSFQNGDRRCAFRVLLDQPVDPDRIEFHLEPTSPQPVAEGR